IGLGHPLLLETAHHRRGRAFHPRLVRAHRRGRLYSCTTTSAEKEEIRKPSATAQVPRAPTPGGARGSGPRKAKRCTTPIVLRRRSANALGDGGRRKRGNAHPAPR